MQSIPRIKESERLSLTEVAPNFWRTTARYGFMERPDIPALLRQARAQGSPLQLDDVTYFVGRETIVHHDGERPNGRLHSSPRWAKRRACRRLFFKLPIDDFVEIGREVAI